MYYPQPNQTHPLRTLAHLGVRLLLPVHPDLVAQRPGPAAQPQGHVLQVLSVQVVVLMWEEQIEMRKLNLARRSVQQPFDSEGLQCHV